MKNNIKKINLTSFLKSIFLSIIVIIIASIFISQKENLDLDEVYTYGLANSHFQLDIEDFKTYDGNELLLDYASAKAPYIFNIKNVFFNQSMDTHPPLYYTLVNIVCSIYHDSFSMWYGLSINILFLVIIFWQMKYLLNFFINNKVLSSIIILLSFTLYGFANAIIFTRMYMMLMCISLSTYILIFNKINDNSKNNINNNISDNIKTNAKIDKNEIIFLIKYFIINIIGILTQYHYMIIAMIVSIYYAIYLIKNKKYKLLILTIIVGALSILTCFLIFPASINHLFGATALHSVSTNQTAKDIPNNFYELFITLYTAFFSKGIYIYIFILLICLITNIILHKIKKINRQFLFNYLSLIILILIYYIIISLTAEWTFARYLYNIYPYIIIVLFVPIYYGLKNINIRLIYIIPLLLISLFYFSTMQNLPSSLNVGDNYFEIEYLEKNKNVNTILVYRTKDKNGNENTMGTTSKWKLPRPIYLFRNIKNMTFVDVSDINNLRNSICPALNNQDDTLLIIYTTEDDNTIINELMKKNNYRYCNKVYFTMYTHIYRLN